MHKTATEYTYTMELPNHLSLHSSITTRSAKQAFQPSSLHLAILIHGCSIGISGVEWPLSQLSKHDRNKVSVEVGCSTLTWPITGPPSAKEWHKMKKANCNAQVNTFCELLAMPLALQALKAKQMFQWHELTSKREEVVTFWERSHTCASIQPYWTHGPTVSQTPKGPGASLQFRWDK